MNRRLTMYTAVFVHIHAPLFTGWNAGYTAHCSRIDLYATSLIFIRSKSMRFDPSEWAPVWTLFGWLTTVYSDKTRRDSRNWQSGRVGSLYYIKGDSPDKCPILLMMHNKFIYLFHRFWLPNFKFEPESYRKNILNNFIHRLAVGSIVKITRKNASLTGQITLFILFIKFWT